LGVILAATYILKMYQHVYMGDEKPAPHANENTYKLHWTEIVALIPILIAIFWIGIQPGGFFDKMASSTKALVAHVDTAYASYQGSVVADAGEEDAAAEPDAEATEASGD
jgi:NADH-quinone oxidoreductase subunit M